MFSFLGFGNFDYPPTLLGKDKPKPEPAETKAESSEKPSRNRQNRQLTSPDNEESEEGQDLADKSEETTTEGEDLNTSAEGNKSEEKTTEGEDLNTSAEGEDATPTTITEGTTQATPRPGWKRRRKGRKMKRKCAMRGKGKRRRGGFATTPETIILQVSGREKGRRGGNQKKGGRVIKCAMGLGKRGKRFRRPYPNNKTKKKVAPKTTTESTTKPSMFRSFRKLKTTTNEPKGIMEKRMSALSAFTKDTNAPE